MLYVHRVAVKGIYSLLTCLSEAEHAGAGSRDAGEKALSVTQERRKLRCPSVLSFSGSSAASHHRAVAILSVLETSVSTLPNPSPRPSIRAQGQGLMA